MEHRMRFLRVSLGFGWCLEGTKPEEEGVDLERWGRRRKRVDVFGKVEGEGEGRAKRGRVDGGDALAGSEIPKESGNGGIQKEHRGNDDMGKDSRGRKGTAKNSSPKSGVDDQTGTTSTATNNSSSSQNSSNNYGVGEVGRLCIWCVKM